MYFLPGKSPRVWLLDRIQCKLYARTHVLRFVLGSLGAEVWIKGCNAQSAPTPPCCPPTGPDRHRFCISHQVKNWRFTMFLSGYVLAFVIGVAVGFVFSNIILFGNRLDQTPWTDGQEQGYSLHLLWGKLLLDSVSLAPIGLGCWTGQWGLFPTPLHAPR